MGNYVTAVTEIASEFKDTSFSGTTVVTSTEVDNIINEMESYINSIVGKKYAVPVTAAGSVPMLRRITKWLVADTVADILNSRGVEVGQTQKANLSRDYQRAQDWLTQITEGEIVLPGAPPTGDPTVDSYAVTNALEPKWLKDTEQW